MGYPKLNLTDIMRLTQTFTRKAFKLLDSKSMIAFAVAKDEKGSAIGWHITWDKAMAAKYRAKQALKNKGYKDVFLQCGDEEFGHFLKRGFWVVIKTIYTTSNGATMTAYGMGANGGDYDKAELQAVEQVKRCYPDWQEAYGYEVSKKGIF